MRLEIASFQVDDVVFCSETRLDGNTLLINERDLKDRMLPNPYIKDIRLDVARPGESVRIVNALDVVEPRDKVAGYGTIFPGRLGPPTQVGSGTTNRLAGIVRVR